MQALNAAPDALALGALAGALDELVPGA